MVDAAAGPVAVVAPLLAQLAGAALGALVDGVLPRRAGGGLAGSGGGAGSWWRVRQAAWRQAGVQSRWRRIGGDGVRQAGRAMSSRCRDAAGASAGRGSSVVCPIVASGGVAVIMWRGLGSVWIALRE